MKEKKSILITKKQKQLLDDLLKKNAEDMKVEEFMKWTKDNFQLDEFYLNFELVPLPTTESAVILDILQRSDAQSQVADVNWYVLSYRWWELWRSYIHNDFNKIAQLKKKYNKGKKNKKEKKEELKVTELDDTGEIAEENAQEIAQRINGINLQRKKKTEEAIPSKKDKLEKNEDNVGKMFKEEMQKISKEILSGEKLKEEVEGVVSSPFHFASKNVIVSK